MTCRPRSSAASVVTVSCPPGKTSEDRGEVGSSADEEGPTPSLASAFASSQGRRAPTWIKTAAAGSEYGGRQAPGGNGYGLPYEEDPASHPRRGPSDGAPVRGQLRR